MPNEASLFLPAPVRVARRSELVSFDVQEISVPRQTVTITPYQDGPYLIRGAFSLLDQDGNEIPLSRRTIALCRCGRSQIRPFCDGTHRLVGFRAQGASERPSTTEQEGRHECGERAEQAREAIDPAA